MEATIEGAARSIKEASNLAFSWLKDMSNLAQVLEAKVEANKENIQDNKDNIKGNVTEIFCIKANQEPQDNKLGSLEGQIRNQETTLIFQERKLEKLEEQNRQKDERIQALTERIEALPQPVYQAFPVQYVPPFPSDPNQLLEQQ